MNIISFKNTTIFLAIILIALIFMFICIFIQKRKKLKQTEYDLNYLKAEFNRQNQLLKNSEISSTEFRGIYHDFKNHLICLNAFLEKKDCNGAKQYLDGLNHEDLSNGFISTGNIVFDSILNEKSRLALKNNINFRYEVILPQVLNIELTDLCIVMGNILDNAIEACMRIKNNTNEKIIELSVKYNDDYLCICLKNSTDVIFKKEDGFFKSSKQEGGIHGIGMKSVNAAVLKYEGNLCFQCLEGKFEVNILMKNRLY